MGHVHQRRNRIVEGPISASLFFDKTEPTGVKKVLLYGLESRKKLTRKNRFLHRVRHSAVFYRLFGSHTTYS